MGGEFNQYRAQGRRGDILCGSRYPYVSHLICNAGAAFFGLVDILGAIRSFIYNGISVSITVPSYKVQSVGLVDKDGLGTIWHSNLFGHYLMVSVLCH